MYHPGEVRTPGLELMLILIRILIFAGVIVLVSGIGLLLSLPASIAGIIAGITGFGLLLGGSLFEVMEVQCPSCQAKARVITNFGSYQCSSCGRRGLIKEGKSLNF